jgi:hypothetical protein
MMGLSGPHQILHDIIGQLISLLHICYHLIIKTLRGGRLCDIILLQMRK